MWTFAIIVLVLALAVVGVHRFRWPLFNAAIRAQRAKAGLTEKVVSVDGHDVVYLDGGSGDPLILLHGFGANKDNWTRIAPLLSPHFRLIIPDLPGFGDSTRDPKAHYDTDSLVARLKYFIDDLNRLQHICFINVKRCEAKAQNIRRSKITNNAMRG